MAFWSCAEDAQSTQHVHDFDESHDPFSGVVVRGCYTLGIEDQRIPLRTGDEYVIARGVVHGGEVVAGTRTIHAFGGHRADRAGDV